MPSTFLYQIKVFGLLTLVGLFYPVFAGDSYFQVFSLQCVLETSAASLSQLSLTSNKLRLAAQLKPWAPLGVFLLPWQRQCCALLGTDVCSVGFQCRCSQILPSAPGHDTPVPPLSQGSFGSSSRYATRNLLPDTMGMLGYWLDLSKASWIGLERRHTLTVSEP